MKKVINHPIVKTHFPQLWRFAICGGMGFVLDLSSATAFVEYAGMDQRYAVVLSSFVGAAFVFVANKFFTFKNHEAASGQLLKFVLVYGVAIAMNGVLSNAFIWIGLHYLIAKILAIGIGAVWNYALSHGFVFKKGEDVDVGII